MNNEKIISNTINQLHYGYNIIIPKAQQGKGIINDLVWELQKTGIYNPIEIISYELILNLNKYNKYNTFIITHQQYDTVEENKIINNIINSLIKYDKKIIVISYDGDFTADDTTTRWTHITE